MTEWTVYDLLDIQGFNNRLYDVLVDYGKMDGLYDDFLTDEDRKVFDGLSKIYKKLEKKIQVKSREINYEMDN